MSDSGASLSDLFIPMPPILKLCKRCGVTSADVGAVAVVVSPRRTAHLGSYDGQTDCGIDATGDKWWWPL